MNAPEPIHPSVAAALTTLAEAERAADAQLKELRDRSVKLCVDMGGYPAPRQIQSKVTDFFETGLRTNPAHFDMRAKNIIQAGDTLGLVVPELADWREGR